MNIPLRINYLGDKAKAATLKGVALQSWDFHLGGIGDVAQASRTKRLAGGIEIIMSFTMDAYEQRGGSIDIYVPPVGGGQLSGFLYLHRWTADDEAEDPTHIADTVSGRHDLLATDKTGFTGITKNIPHSVGAGTEYWTDGVNLISWLTNVSGLNIMDGIKLNTLIGRGRFDNTGQIYVNGNKAGHVHPQTIYAAKVDKGILAIVGNGSAFDTMYTNLSGDYYQFKQYNDMAIRNVNISQDGTKLVVIAYTGTTAKIPADFPANSHALFDNYWEDVVEYTIIKNDTSEDPITLTEISRATQYCMAAVGKHITVSRIIDADITLAEHDAYTPPADIVTTTSCGTMTISRAATSVTYGAMVQYRITESCAAGIQVYGNSLVMCEDNGNGTVTNELSSVYLVNGVTTEMDAYDMMLDTGGDTEWFVSSSKVWTLTNTKLSLVTTSLFYVEVPDPLAGEGDPASYLKNNEVVDTVVYDTHAVSAATDMVVDAWYDKDGILKKETITGARFFKKGHYGYTIKHPYLADKACVVDKVFSTDGTVSTKTSTASYLHRNNYYIENAITEDMSMAVTGGNGDTPAATLSRVITDTESAIAFTAIVDANQTNATPFFGVFPYPDENTGPTGYRPVISRNAVDSIFSERIMLSDRYDNKIILYYDDSVVKVAAFEVKPSDADPLIPEPFTPVGVTVLEKINAVIYSTSDIIGVI